MATFATSVFISSVFSKLGECCGWGGRQPLHIYCSNVDNAGREKMENN
jgi:hypothetical protein